MLRKTLPLMAPILLAACGEVPPAQPNADQGSIDPAQATTAAGKPDTDPKTDPPLPTDAWLGKWVGVEGLALDIERGATPGTYQLTITLLDGTGTYHGTAVGDRIRFARNGVEESIRKASGAETGLKWLADKQDCLMIKPGEGFCRG